MRRTWLNVIRSVKLSFSESQVRGFNNLDKQCMDVEYLISWNLRGLEPKEIVLLMIYIIVLNIWWDGGQFKLWRFLMSQREPYTRTINRCSSKAFVWFLDIFYKPNVGSYLYDKINPLNVNEAKIQLETSRESVKSTSVRQPLQRCRTKVLKIR